MDQNMSITKIINTIRWFGLPSYFVTISPNDLDQKIIFRIYTDIESFNNKVNPILEETIIDLTKLDVKMKGKILNENPILTSNIFKQLMDAILSKLLQLSPSNQSKTFQRVKKRAKGIFGTTLAYNFVIETQDKGTLHAHGLVLSLIHI